MERLVQLKPNEEVLLVVREDMIPHMPKFLFLLVWFLLPFFFLFPLISFGIPGVVVFAFAVLSSILFLIRYSLMRRYTALIITDRRIVDVEQAGLFTRNVTELAFTQVDEVSYRIQGFWPTVLRLGTVCLKTSGSAANVDFCRVRQPMRVQDLINDLRQLHLTAEQRNQAKKMESLTEELTQEERHQLEGRRREKERSASLDSFFRSSI